MKSRLLAPSPEAAHLLDRWDGPAAAPAGSAAVGLITVAETDCVDVASASPSSSPAATRLLQEQYLLDAAPSAATHVAMYVHGVTVGQALVV